MLLNPVIRPVFSPEFRSVFDRRRAGGGGGGGGVTPDPGDFLVDESGNFLVDESSNFLTA